MTVVAAALSAAVNGVINVRSDVLVAVWKKFREHGIRTPLGHRDVFINEASELTVRLKPGADGTAA